jgi:NTE family protein
MGAVVGGMYSAGHLAAYRNWLLGQSKSDVYRLLDLAFSTAGLVKGDRIFEAMKHISGEARIEDLAIPFTAVATDLVTRTEIHFSSGDLHQAMRASTGIPGMFTPVALDKHLLVDGGVLNPLPVNVVKRQPGAIVVAVSLNGAPSRIDPQSPSDSAGMVPRMHRYLSHSEEERALEDAMGLHHPRFSMFELLSESYDATRDRLVELTLRLRRPDILIEVPRDACALFDFHRAAEVIEIGRTAFRSAFANDVEGAGIGARRRDDTQPPMEMAPMTG